MPMHVPSYFTQKTEHFVSLLRGRLVVVPFCANYYFFLFIFMGVGILYDVLDAVRTKVCYQSWRVTLTLRLIKLNKCNSVIAPIDLLKIRS